MADAATQRLNMVESQVRPSDVTDRRILRAMGSLPREQFVPGPLKALAYMDDDITLEPAKGGKPGRGMLAPRALARLMQLAALESGDTVLVVGAATGYGAAIAGRIASKVVALECDARLAEEARKALAAVEARSVAVVQGDLGKGAASAGPYDVILIEGTVETVSAELLDQLKDGGRLVAIVADGPLGRATSWRRDGETFASYAAFETTGPRLPGFERAAEFAL